MNTGVPIDDVIEAITGKRPAPIEIKDQLLREMRDEMGRVRRESQIADEKVWLEQLARFREPTEDGAEIAVLAPRERVAESAKG